MDDLKMLDSVASKFDAIISRQLEVVAVSPVGSIFEFIEKLYDFMVSIRFCFRSHSLIIDLYLCHQE